MSEGFYTPEADVTETGPDGVQRLVAAKGIAIPMEDARRLGLIKDNQKKAGPSETKEGDGAASAQPQGGPSEGLQATEGGEAASSSVTFTPAPEFEEAVSEGDGPKKKGAK